MNTEDMYLSPIDDTEPVDDTDAMYVNSSLTCDTGDEYDCIPDDKYSSKQRYVQGSGVTPSSHTDPPPRYHGVTPSSHTEPPLRYHGVMNMKQSPGKVTELNVDGYDAVYSELGDINDKPSSKEHKNVEPHSAPCPVQCSRPWRTLAVVMTILALLGLVIGLYFTFRGQKDEPSPPMEYLKKDIPVYATQTNELVCGASITCIAFGSPPPTYTWTAPNGTVTDGATTNVTGVGFQYLCTATNIHGSSVLNYTVGNFLMCERPKNLDIIVKAGQLCGATLTCVAQGYPSPTFKWTAPDGTVTNGDSLNIASTDIGYLCTATNTHGSSTLGHTARNITPCNNCGLQYTNYTYNRASGVYAIRLSALTINAYCDMMTDGGGWLVIQRRMDGSVNFLRNWADYKQGFGNPSGEFWLGNDYLHELTSSGGSSYSLRVDMEAFNGSMYYAQYENVRIGNEAGNYRLTFTGYRGNAGDSLTRHKGKPFTTIDRDNDDQRDYNCAERYTGAWWYTNCLDSNLNGQYYGTEWTGVVWWKDLTMNCLKSSEMKIRSIITRQI